MEKVKDTTEKVIDKVKTITAVGENVGKTALNAVKEKVKDTAEKVIVKVTGPVGASVLKIVAEKAKTIFDNVSQKIVNLIKFLFQLI